MQDICLCGRVTGKVGHPDKEIDRQANQKDARYLCSLVDWQMTKVAIAGDLEYRTAHLFQSRALSGDAQQEGFTKNFLIRPT